MADARVGIDIEAEDDSGPVFDDAGKRIDELGKKADDAASGGLKAFADATVDGARGVERAMSMMTRLDLVQITLEQSADRVAAAQDNYNQALAEFGEGSAQATAAGNQLEAALVAQEKAALRANLSFGLVGVQALQMSVTAIPALRTALVSLTAAQTASAGAAALLNITLTAGVAAISITAGILAVKAAMDGMATSTDAAAAAVGRFNGAGDDAATQKAIDAAQQRVATADMEYQHRQEVERLMATGTVESINTEMEARRARRDELVQLLDQDNTAFLAAEQRRLESDRRFLDDMQRGLARGPAEGVDADRWAASMEGVIARTEAKIAGRESLLADAILTPERAQEIHSEIQILNRDLEAFGAINQRLATATSSAYRSVGIDITRFSQEFQEGLLAAAGVSQEFIATMRPLVTAEQLLAASSGETREALLEQLEVTARKGETTEDLAKRLGLTADEEARLREEGRLTTEGIISQEEATRSLAASTGELAGNLTRAGTVLNGGGNLPTLPGWAGAARPGGGRGGGFDPVGLGMASLLNTAPGVDVTGVQRGLYAPFGGGFVSGGRIGSTDLGSAYGSRTIVNQHTGQALVGRNDAQGSGQVNMGGVTIVQYINGGTPGAVQQQTVGAMSQVQGRAAARRTI